LPKFSPLNKPINALGAEAYSSLKEWMDFRSSYGEKITGDSWVMRDIWQTTNIDYGARLAYHILSIFPTLAYDCGDISQSKKQ
jgi:hypothetical protein